MAQQPPSGQGRPGPTREFILGILSSIITITLGILINYYSPLAGAYTVQVATILLIAVCLSSLIKYIHIPLRLSFTLPSIQIGNWPKFSRNELLSIAGVIGMIILVIFSGVSYFHDLKYVSVGDEKALARNYCASLQQHDYHRIYTYYAGGHDLTIGSQPISDETTFMTVASAADKNGTVSDCHYQTAIPQKETYSCEIIHAGDAGGEVCTENYILKLLIKRGGTSYITSMNIVLTTGSYDHFGHINTIDRL